MLARQLGGVRHFTEDKERELLSLKKEWGYEDVRNKEEYKDCDICGNDIFRNSWKDTGVERRAFEPPPEMRSSSKPDSNAGPADPILLLENRDIVSRPR